MGPVLPQEDLTSAYDWPRPESEKLEIASLSDSSDCNHVGNGIPCRFYNHEGCAKGDKCIFSHAPDEKSVRDDLYVFLLFQLVHLRSRPTAVNSEAGMSARTISSTPANLVRVNVYTVIPKSIYHSMAGGTTRKKS